VRRALVKFHPLNVNPWSLTFSEDIPAASGGATRALVSNLGDGTGQVLELRDGTMRSVGKVPVGAVPKRVAWVQPPERGVGSAP
jgi:hypothetical protein